MQFFERFVTFVTVVAVVRSATYIDPCGRSDQCNHNPFPNNNEISPSPYNCSVYDSCQLGGVWWTFSCNVTHRWFDMFTLQCEPQSTNVTCQPPCANTSTSASAPDSTVDSTSPHNPHGDSTTESSAIPAHTTGSVDISLIVGLCVGLGLMNDFGIVAAA